MEQEKAWAGLRQMLEGLREVYVLAHETGNRTLSWMVRESASRKASELY